MDLHKNTGTGSDTRPPDAQAMTRHNYRECYQCTASRPRFCEVYYEQENAFLIEQVKSALLDQSTPGGVKATYQQLLDVNTAQRETIRRLEGENKTLLDAHENPYENERPAQEAHDAALRATIQQQAERIERLTAERDEAQSRYEKQCEGTMTRIRRIQSLERQLAERDVTIAELRQRKDGAYLERNQVVAALAKCFPSGIARTAIDGWDEEWHGCVYIDLPTGQVSWHYHDSHASLFAGLPPYTKPWDGHTTEEKYQRLTNLQHAEQREQRLREALQMIHEGIKGIECKPETRTLHEAWRGSPESATVHFYRWLAQRALSSPSPQGGDAPNRER